MERDNKLEELTSRFHGVEKVINKWWPVYWPIHEACLATSATLLLKNVAQCVALVLIGDSGSGKGSILHGYGLADNTVFRSRFTAASLLSTYGEAARQDLESRALFRLVKHRVFVCSDLNPLLKAGDKTKLSRFYADLAIWLDGEGLVYDSGTHGPVGERGDFTFAMIGAATPFRSTVWRNMAELGPRLLFIRFRRKSSMDVPAKDYDKARDECGIAVRDFISWIFGTFDVRSQEWRSSTEEEENLLRQYSKLAASGQTFGGGNLSCEELIRPTHSHLFQRLSTIVHARALLHGHSKLEKDDLDFAERIARSSTPGNRGPILFQLSKGSFEVSDIAKETGLPNGTVQASLEDLQRNRLVELCGFLPREARGRPAAVWKLLDEEES